MIICGTDNGLIYIRNIEDPKFEKIINAHTDAINDILLISNKTFLTCSEKSGTIKYFDLDTFDCIRTFTGHSLPVFTINKFSTDKFVSNSLDSINIWSLNETTCLKSIKASFESCRKLIVISDKIIISQRDQSLLIWNVETGEKTGEIEINEQILIFIKLSSRKIATGHHNYRIKIWDIKTRECLQTIEQLDFSWIVKLSNNSIIFGYDSSSIKILDISKYKSGQIISTGKSNNCIKSLESKVINRHNLFRIELL